MHTAGEDRTDGPGLRAERLGAGRPRGADSSTPPSPHIPQSWGVAGPGWSRRNLGDPTPCAAFAEGLSPSCPGSCWNGHPPTRAQRRCGYWTCPDRSAKPSALSWHNVSSKARAIVRLRGLAWCWDFMPWEAYRCPEDLGTR